MIEIIPSILTDNADELRDLISRCEGVVDRISIDIIDGKFANNKTVDPSILEEIETNLKIDYQLMVIEPINWIERCLRGQADTIIGHVERMEDQDDFVESVLGEGVYVGLGLDLPTPISQINSSIFGKLDTVLLMSVPAGFGGQDFDRKVLDKIKKLDEIRSESDFSFKIQDDGGVSLETVDEAHFFGVDEVSIGRRIFKGDLKQNLEKFQHAAHNLKFP
jgi:ribulose-phosphate 3-epimerase